MPAQPGTALQLYIAETSPSPSTSARRQLSGCKRQPPGGGGGWPVPAQPAFSSFLSEGLAAFQVAASQKVLRLPLSLWRVVK